MFDMSTYTHLRIPLYTSPFHLSHPSSSYLFSSVSWNSINKFEASLVEQRKALKLANQVTGLRREEQCLKDIAGGSIEERLVNV